MKKVTVTDQVADLISKVQTDSGLLEQKAFICDAITDSVKQMSQSENYSENDFMPLQALNNYKELMEELAKSEDSYS